MNRSEKEALRKMSEIELKSELQDRQMHLLKINVPAERRQYFMGTNAEGKPRTGSPHSYSKIKKEIALIKTILNERRRKQ